MDDFYSIGKTALNQGNYKKAILNFKKALQGIDYQNKNIYILTDLGYTYLTIEDFTNSLFYLNKALEINPDFLYANYNKACLLHNLKEFDEEEIILNNLIKKHPTYSHSYYQLALVLNSKVDDHYNPQRIIELCDRFISLNGSDSKVYFLKGMVLYNNKLYKEAKQSYKKGLLMDTSMKPFLNEINEMKKSVQTIPYTYEIVPLFSDQLYLSILDASEYRLNQDLKTLIFEMEEKYTSDNVSSNGGWQSPRRFNFLDSKHHKNEGLVKGLDQLKLFILLNASNFVQTLNFPKNKTMYFSIKESWANINRKGNFNHKHNHLLNTISGCYYVDSGHTEKKNNTSLIFYNNKGDMNSNHLLGKEGTLALWDSEIYHSVPQHSGTKERIVIAFNINFIVK